MYRSTIMPSSLTLFDIGSKVPATSTCEMTESDLVEWRDPNRTASDLSFKARPFWANQECNDKSQFSRSWSLEELLRDNEMCSWVSTVYCCWPTLWLLAMRAIGEIYVVNRMGPWTDSCGTPVQQAVEVERLLPIPNWLRSWRYDDIQFNAMCETPKDVWSLSRRMLWSMMSKAELMSSDTRSVELPWSMELRILSAVASNDVSVEWCWRYADWLGLKLGHDVTWFWIRVRKRRSKSFEILFRLEMGR